MGQLISLRSLIGLIAPIFGTLADKVGHKIIMRLGLFLSGIGLLFIATGYHISIIILGMIIVGIGGSIYIPNLQAYLGMRLPHNQRARMIGIVEYSWALSGIIGVFLAGLLIAASNWQMPLIVLGIGLLIAGFISATLPRDISHISPSVSDSHLPKQNYWSHICAFFDLGNNAKSAWAAITANGLNFFAMVHIIIIYGGWLEMEYGLEAYQLGTVALIIGLFDWGASIIFSIIGDKFGRKQSVLFGVVGTVISYLLFPFLNLSLKLAVVSLVLIRFCFEFAILSNIILVLEQVPEQQGKILSLNMAGALIGITIAGFTGPWAYLSYGVWGLGPVSLIAALLSLGVLISIVQVPYPTTAV